MTKNTKRTVSTGSNLDRTRRVVQLRSSNAAGPHTPKPRKGTRTAQRNKAIKESQMTP